MVRSLLIICLLGTSVVSTAQTLSFGGRLGTGIGSAVSLGAPRDYYIIDSGRELIRTSGKGYMELDPFLPPEVFFRYTSKNRIFIQLAFAFIATNQTTFYGLDPEIEEMYNPFGRGPREGFHGTVPQDHIGMRSLYFTPSLTFNYFLTKGTVIKPYAGIGLVPSFMQSNIPMSYIPFSDYDIAESVMLKDFGVRKDFVVNARAAAGIQFYGLHAEFHMLSNLTPIDSSPNSYHKRMTSFFVSIGYTLLNFNLTKKSRI